MDAFALRISGPSGPVSSAAATDTDTDTDTPRLARLRAAGWRVATLGEGVSAALCGRAAIGVDGNWTAIGLSTLHNEKDLRAAHPGAGEGDITLIAHLRARHGTGFPAQLKGGFAVVLIHSETGEVEAYRDHFGMIPFYHTVQDGALTCASDIRAALHLSRRPLEDDLTRIADFLMAKDVDREITAFSGLTRLRAAHRLTWEEGQVQTARYWSLDLPPVSAARDAPARLQGLLAQATAGAMHDIDTVGAMLSGGLDSSSLAGLAARTRHDQGGTALPALSFVYGPGNPMDESLYIDAANAAFLTDPRPIPTTTAPRLADIPPLIEEQMDLFLALGLQKSRNIYRVAAEQGLSALLDGHGGDEVISQGFGYLIELAAMRKWGQLFIEMRGASRIYGQPYLGAYCLYIVRHGGLAPRNPLRRVLNRIARALLPGKAVQSDAVTLVDILAPALRDNLDPDVRYAPDPGPTTRAERLRAEQIEHLDILNHPRMEIAFEALHRSAVHQGILPLYPFYDRPVVEFCLSVPAEAKMKGGLSRWVLREAMRDVLPKLIRIRTTKTDFTDEFRATVTDYLAMAGPQVFGNLGRYVDTDRADRLRVMMADPDKQGISNLRLCWRLAVLEQWRTAFENWRDLQAKGELI
jgi:asparagine synthase (glutamine-hydrolysing)